METPVEMCPHSNVSFRNTDGAHHCDGCNASFMMTPDFSKYRGQITIMEPYATLRNQFAMASLTGLLSTATAKIGASDIRAVTFLSYQLADSMMEARKQ